VILADTNGSTKAEQEVQLTASEQSSIAAQADSKLDSTSSATQEGFNPWSARMGQSIREWGQPVIPPTQDIDALSEPQDIVTQDIPSESNLLQVLPTQDIASLSSETSPRLEDSIPLENLESMSKVFSDAFGPNKHAITDMDAESRLRSQSDFVGSSSPRLIDESEPASEQKVRSLSEDVAPTQQSLSTTGAELKVETPQEDAEEEEEVAGVLSGSDGSFFSRTFYSLFRQRR
jgi:hypothetical protein